MKSSPLIFILFGATGDLAQKKVMPSLFKLYFHDKLPEKFSIIAFSRRSWNDEEYRNFISPSLPQEHNEKLKSFLSHIIYTEGQFQDDSAYNKLAEKVKGIVDEYGKGTLILSYLAVLPDYYDPILHGIARAELGKEIDGSKQPRLLIEKPFGRDTASAQGLEKKLEKLFSGSCILRIDHYLNKAGLRKFVEKRRTDKDFEEKINNKNIRKISVKLLEKSTVAGRGEFFDRVGAVRDVGQNHLLEMLALVLMDLKKPENEARADAMNALCCVGIPIVGQYEGYLEEKNVAKDSRTETYFKFQIKSTDPKWAGVLLELEGGKGLSEYKSEIEIEYLDSKKEIFSTTMEKGERDAYELMLEHAILGNPIYFAGIGEVLASWNLLTPILDNKTFEIIKYKIGSKNI